MLPDTSSPGGVLIYKVRVSFVLSSKCATDRYLRQGGAQLTRSKTSDHFGLLAPLQDWKDGVKPGESGKLQSEQHLTCRSSMIVGFGRGMVETPKDGSVNKVRFGFVGNSQSLTSASQASTADIGVVIRPSSSFSGGICSDWVYACQSQDPFSSGLRSSSSSHSSGFRRQTSRLIMTFSFWGVSCSMEIVCFSNCRLLANQGKGLSRTHLLEQFCILIDILEHLPCIFIGDICRSRLRKRSVV